MDSTRLAMSEPIAQHDTTRYLRFDAPRETAERPWFWQVERRDPPMPGHDETPAS